jgi:2-keto-3-deoxy-L-rhamnonate aldolase RhmA
MTRDSFRRRVRRRDRLVGTFVKTPAHQVVEVLASTDLDFLVIDAEHAPFGRADIDVGVLGARASGMPVLVRIPNVQADTVLNVLDVGATGILVPHARCEHTVREAIAASRYRCGTRGFSNSPRAGGYGCIAMSRHVDQADRDAVVIGQVEDSDAIGVVERLAAIDEVDCLFVGRADLALSMGADDIQDPRVEEAVAHVLATCRAAGKASGVFVADAGECARFERLGASLFIVGSDQSLLRSYVGHVTATVRQGAV